MNARKLLPLAMLSVAGALASTAASAQVYDYYDRYDDRYYDSRYDDRYYNNNYNTRYGYTARSIDNRYGYSDRTIDNRVERDLSRAMGNMGSRINARVIDGRVYLSGYVPNMRDRQIAADVAARVPGVRAVYAADLYAGRPGYRPY